MPESIFKKLMIILEKRKQSSPSSSYTAALYHKGIYGINKKITEEAEEVCLAAADSDTDHLVHELADLFYHTLVLASYKDIKLEQITVELEKRFGTSGHTEKASRKQKK
ncbi:MAG TPA: phosphoribosyl-ATP diphosphatase [Spirochaetota bacterium]|nr:phosphoribosyl-ATP diphosphatase [Spirochaetota bacterium]